MSADDRFCDECGIDLGLHAGDDSCDLAAQKVDLMNQFYGAFLR